MVDVSGYASHDRLGDLSAVLNLGCAWVTDISSVIKLPRPDGWYKALRQVHHTNPVAGSMVLRFRASKQIEASCPQLG